VGGIEFRREGIELRPDALLQSGALANQAPELPVSADRPAAAAFAKVDVPLTASLDAYVAGRFDKTRGFDSHLSPALGLSWSPLPSVTLRATRFAGYRAPALSELHRFGGSLGTSVPQFYWIPRDLGPCAVQIAETPEQLGCELYTTSISNESLQAETSYTNALAFAWFPSPSFSFDVDLYDTLRNNEIAELPLEYALEHPDLFPGFLSRNGQALVSINEMLVNIGHTRTRGIDLEAHWDVETAAAGRFKIGFDWFPSPVFGLDVDVYDTLRNKEIAELPLEYALEHPDLYPGFLSRNADQALVGINEMLVNIGHTRTRGVDFEAHWDIETADAGRFKIGFGLNYLGDLEREVIPGTDPLQSAGFRSEPRVTAVTSLRWATGPWITGANLRYTGNYAYEEYDGAADSCPAYKATIGKCRTPSFTLVNLSLTYVGLPHWSFSGYVNNVFDHTPRYYDEASGGYNAIFDDPVGRYFAVRATYAF